MVATRTREPEVVTGVAGSKNTPPEGSARSRSLFPISLCAVAAQARSVTLSVVAIQL
jgi:hypothetical protein